MVWYSRRPTGAPGTWELCLNAGDEHEEGAVVEAPPVRSLVTARVSPSGVVSLLVDRSVAPVAAAPWFVTQPEPAAQPPGMTLVAFDTPRPSGAVIPAAEFTALPVRNAAQIGAVRWFTGTGQVHQVYVALARRRQGIGTVLLLAAGTFAVASGWPRLWGNGERTELGESLVTRGHEVIRRRATAHTRTLPPMTPGDGVRRS